MHLIFLHNKNIIHETNDISPSPEIDDTITISDKNYIVTSKTYNNPTNAVIIHVNIINE